MNWLNEVQNRINRKNQVLFAKSSEFLADLAALIQEQNHRTMVLWAPMKPFKSCLSVIQTKIDSNPLC
jgi:hypothetical protein